jgi:hypothetical protein
LAFLNPQTHSPTLYLNRNPLHRAAPRPDKTDTVVDVQVTPTAPTEPEPLQGDNIEQALPQGDIEQVLNKIPLPSRKTLAKSKGTDARGTRANIARRLKTLVTLAELRVAG